AAILGADGQSGNTNDDGPNYGPNDSAGFVFHHNVFDNNGEERAAGAGGPHYSQAQTFYNNTIYSTNRHIGSYGCMMYTQTNANTNNIQATCIGFYNNIYYTTANTGSGGAAHAGRLCLNPGLANGGATSNGTNSSGWITVDYNSYYDISANYSGYWAIGTSAPGETQYSSFSSWKSATQAIVSSTDSHSITVNPTFQFISGTYTLGQNPNVQFALQGGSPCINTGNTGGNMGALDGTGTVGAAWV